MADLVIKLLPILHVPDPDAEWHFYERLGLRTTYEGPEYPGFIAVGNDAVEFGLSPQPGADPAASGFTWQLGVPDIGAAIAACQEAGLGFEVTEERPRGDWAYRIVKIRSPNGMEVLLEEQAHPPDPHRKAQSLSRTAEPPSVHVPRRASGAMHPGGAEFAES